jgi:C_GCAxxG_C_C family probable redox protein
MNKVEMAVSLFQEGFLCSQAILAVYGAQFGLDRETALRIAGPFGGGISRMGLTCGAVTGAFMALGLKHSAIRADDKESRLTTYEMVKEFSKLFASRNGSISCADLLGVNIGETEGYTKAIEKNLFMTLCPKFVRDAAEIVEEILGA